VRDCSYGISPLPIDATLMSILHKEAAKVHEAAMNK